MERNFDVFLIKYEYRVDGIPKADEPDSQNLSLKAKTIPKSLAKDLYSVEFMFGK